MIKFDIRDRASIGKPFAVAVSGGVDSMAMLDFVSRGSAKWNLTPMFFHHNTDEDEEALRIVESFCYNRELTLKKGRIVGEKPSDQSLEEWWRNQRIAYFAHFPGVVLTAHTLDDCVETWIWSSLHGAGKIIPYANGNIRRPFRLTRKSQFQNWCRSKGVNWYEDETNSNTNFMRNYIRHEIVQKALVVNPGLYKTIAKKITEEQKL